MCNMHPPFIICLPPWYLFGAGIPQPSSSQSKASSRQHLVVLLPKRLGALSSPMAGAHTRLEVLRRHLGPGEEDEQGIRQQPTNAEALTRYAFESRACRKAPLPTHSRVAARLGAAAASPAAITMQLTLSPPCPRVSWRRPTPGGGAGSLTVVDNRTGKRYEIPISEHGTIKATDLKQIKAGGDGVGLRTFDNGCGLMRVLGCSLGACWGCGKLPDVPGMRRREGLGPWQPSPLQPSCQPCHGRRCHAAPRRVFCRYVNTTACKSAISYIDGDAGILRYRGIPIEQLAQRSSFLDVGAACGGLRRSGEPARCSSLWHRWPCGRELAGWQDVVSPAALACSRP